MQFIGKSICKKRSKKTSQFWTAQTKSFTVSEFLAKYSTSFAFEFQFNDFRLFALIGNKKS